jgi:predicted RNA-binding protein with PUA-like domain
MRRREAFRKGRSMAYWMVKSEPEEFSWDQQVKAGKKGTPWTGVRAHPAKLHLLNMAKGDKAFFYHTGDEKQIVGIVEIAKTAYPDPTAEKDSPWVVVDTVAIEPLKTPVALSQIKDDKALANMALVRIGRLSVQPVTAAEWKHICKLGGVKP